MSRRREAETAPDGPWPRRLGLVAGASVGLLACFAVAALADRMWQGDPEWILRLGSPVGVLGGAAIGLRAVRRLSARGYRILGAATGLAVSGVLVLLLLALFGAAR